MKIGKFFKFKMNFEVGSKKSHGKRGQNKHECFSVDRFWLGLWQQCGQRSTFSNSKYTRVNNFPFILLITDLNR